MRLTLKQSVKRSIEHWTWLAETGGKKEDWPGWDSYPSVRHHCFLCERALKTTYIADGCPACPYRQKFGQCVAKGSYYDRWQIVRTVKTRKKYAKLFLEQLKQLEGGK